MLENVTRLQQVSKVNSHHWNIQCSTAIVMLVAYKLLQQSNFHSSLVNGRKERNRKKMKENAVGLVAEKNILNDDEIMSSAQERIR